MARLEQDLGSLDAVKEMGVEDNTLVIFCSDNGPEFRRPWRGTAGPDDRKGRGDPFGPIIGNDRSAIAPLVDGREVQYVGGVSTAERNRRGSERCRPFLEVLGLDNWTRLRYQERNITVTRLLGTLFDVIMYTKGAKRRLS